MLYNMKMKLVESEKYLGMWLSATAADSVSTTVRKRIGLATMSIYETRTIVEDCRANVVCGLSLAFHIFEACIIPKLLFACETWRPIPKRTLKSLTDFSNKFLKVTLQLGNKGCQMASMYWFTKTMLMENRILLQKVLFVHHLATLEQDSLAYEFFRAQKTNPNVFPGVVSDVQEFLNDHKIQNIERYNKYQFKRLVKKIIWEKDRSDILKMMEGLKKIDHEICAREKHEMKGYFKTMNVADSRMAFKIQNFVVPTIRLNFKSDKKYKAEGWLCPDCRVPGSDVSDSQRIAYSEAKVTVGNISQPGGFLDSQEHVIKHCFANEEMRIGKDMDNLGDCVTLIRHVISRRTNNLS